MKEMMAGRGTHSNLLKAFEGGESVLETSAQQSEDSALIWDFHGRLPPSMLFPDLPNQ